MDVAVKVLVDVEMWRLVKCCQPVELVPGIGGPVGPFYR